MLHLVCSRRQIASKADGSTVDLGNVPITLEELGIDLYPVSGSQIEGPCVAQESVIVTWDGEDDPKDPYNWSLWKKWQATGIGLLASFVCSMNGTILTVAHTAIGEEFHVSDATFPNSYWLTTSWAIGAALWLAPNFTTLIVVRFFSGGCVPLISDAVAGITSNVFHGDRARSVPICLYVTIYLAATSLGPVVGSSILQFLSWRWIGYIELIWTVALFPILIFGLPESRGPAILRVRAKQLRREGKNAYTTEKTERVALSQRILQSVQRPLYMLFTEGVVFVATVWAAFSLGTIYLFTQSVEQVYKELYGWDSVQCGYIQIAIVVGELLGGGFCILTNPWYYASATRNTEAPGTPIPEARLHASIVGGFFGVTGGMFVYGWTSYTSIHWMAPTVGLAMVGFGTTAVIVGNANYLIDAYSKYAASALGAVGFVENISIAFLPLAAAAMYTNLGFQWASSLLAFVSLALVVTPFVVLQWGKEIRSYSPFMQEATIERRGDSAEAAGV
ncbi:hypothetical protein PCG10_000142 [Penicillium crustosum]|uniref:Major facilitator superfamily (MFS) profile domain-containing protein n=1 Tax=Penicillium crustosum TaxID=36656 RepID=A0A9P5GSQ5_PENCR|nr:hypothetical protein PCG10_000142 [Penicillium crustosum]